MRLNSGGLGRRQFSVGNGVQSLFVQDSRVLGRLHDRTREVFRGGDVRCRVHVLDLRRDPVRNDGVAERPAQEGDEFGGWRVVVVLVEVSGNGSGGEGRAVGYRLVGQPGTLLRRVQRFVEPHVPQVHAHGVNPPCIHKLPGFGVSPILHSWKRFICSSSCASPCGASAS